MRKIAKSLVFVGLCFGFTFLASCRGNAEPEIALAESKLDFVEGKADTKTIAVKTGTADEVDPKEVEGLTAVVEEKAIKVTATDKVKAGSHEFIVKGNKGKSSAKFTVTVAKAAQQADANNGHPNNPTKGNGNGNPPVENHVPLPGSQDPNSLVLEHTTIPVPSKFAQSVFTQTVKVVKGEFQSYVSKGASFIKVEPDTVVPGTQIRRVKITVNPSGRKGVFKVALKGKVGPDVVIKVWIPPPPSASAQTTDLKMEQSTLELTEGDKEPKVVKVAKGWATGARVLPQNMKPVEGLDAKVENEPIRVAPVCEGFGYKKGEVLLIDGGPVKLKITSVDDNGSIKEYALENPDKYLPSQRSVNLPLTGESGTGRDAMFDLTNNVKIIATDKLKAGNYNVSINGPGGLVIFLQVNVNAAKTSAGPSVASPDRAS